jgi:hypothetical protein
MRPNLVQVDETIDRAQQMTVARPVRHRRGLDRFFREDVTGCIDAINANVLKRAAQVVAFNR